MFLFFFKLIIFAFILALSFIVNADEKYSKIISFIFSLSLFFSSVLILFFFDFSNVFYYLYTLPIFPTYNVIWVIAVDSFSLSFVILTTFLMSIVFLSTWNAVKYQLKFFYTILMVIELFLIFAFISFDLLFFYFWFESILIPMAILIGVWGNQTRKINAVFYLVIYTVLGSSLMLFSIIYLHFVYQTTNFFILFYLISFNIFQQKFLWICFFLAFAVKIPMIPFHVWLPEAHVEAPTSGSMILAGILLKLGYYGFVRFFLLMFPAANLFFSPFITMLALVGCLYGGLLALSQIDFKKIIAYSSVSHMNLCVLGIFSNDLNALVGSYLLALGHGFVSTALFFLVGCLYERYHTRLLDYYSGLANILPVFSMIFFYFVISNFGFPISINFVAEFLLFLGISKWNFYNFLFLLVYSVISVGYNLWLYSKLCLGTLKFHDNYFLDLSKLELLTVLPLIVLNVVLCFFPNSIINVIVPFFSFIL
jgi:proton-translocating NADH-quinone oxidoreductase chain M